MGKICWITCLTLKNVCFIKEDLAISLIWNNCIIRTTLWSVHLFNNQVVCHYYNQDGHMKNRCPVKKNAYYGMKCIWVPEGTIANTQWPKTFWVPKTWDFLYKAWRRRKINGTWTVVVQGIWPETIHDFQVSPKSKTVEMFSLETMQRERFLKLEISSFINPNWKCMFGWKFETQLY